MWCTAHVYIAHAHSGRARVVICVLCAFVRRVYVRVYAKVYIEYIIDAISQVRAWLPYRPPRGRSFLFSRYNKKKQKRRKTERAMENSIKERFRYRKIALKVSSMIFVFAIFTLFFLSHHSSLINFRPVIRGFNPLHSETFL